MDTIKGKVFDIQRFSVHDGPGIRTTFFMKGCPLRCQWCHNPESIAYEDELQYLSEKCIHCGLCVERCKNHCHSLSQGYHQVDFDCCTRDFTCVASCPAKALRVFGYDITVKEMLAHAEKDRPFYGKEGGITFSGGEATSQWQFLLQSLRSAKAQQLTTALDTSGYCSYSVLETLAPFVDTFLYDVKAITDEIHKKGTGVSNQRILSNLEKLSTFHENIWIRVPVIPEFNATTKEMSKIANYIAGLTNITKVELLPYNSLGKNKSLQIGKPFLYSHHQNMQETQRKDYQSLFIEQGVIL